MDRRQACRRGLSAVAALVAARTLTGCASLEGQQSHGLMQDRPAGLPSRAALVGDDLDRREVQVHSGEHTAAVWPVDTLAHPWAGSGRWAAVGLRLGDLPAMASAPSLQQALADFERSQSAMAARPGWHAAQARFPEDLVLGLGWANALLSSGQTMAAMQAFADQARRHDSAVAGNNLAVLSAGQAQTAAARAAWDRAVERVQGPEPQWRAAVEQTGRELGYILSQ